MMTKEEQWLLKEKYGGLPAQTGKTGKKFSADLKRLKKGEPVDYVIGFKQFLGCKIDLSKKPLIPRPETEFWVAKALEDIKQSMALKKSSEDVKSIVRRSWGHENYAVKVLDMFSGSGCIGCAVMANVLGSEVTFADKDEKAVSQIKINCKLNTFEPPAGRMNKDLPVSKFKVVKSDIFKNINKKEKFDFILANPPYIPTRNKSKIQKSVLKYEPKIALFGGTDGLKLINKFLKEAPKYLTPPSPGASASQGGRVYMEFDPPQKNKIENLLKTLRHGSGRVYKKWDFYKDQYGKDRWVVANA